MTSQKFLSKTPSSQLESLLSTAHMCAHTCTHALQTSPCACTHTQTPTIVCAHTSAGSHTSHSQLLLSVLSQIKSSVNRKNAKYVLQGEYAGTIFRVDADTGDVFAFERLDREKVFEYFLTALIVDKETNVNLEQPSNFTVKVHDVNDNWPVFKHQVFNASVPEMSAVGMYVLSLPSLSSSPQTSLKTPLTSATSLFRVRLRQVQGSGFGAMVPLYMTSEHVPKS